MVSKKVKTKQLQKIVTLRRLLAEQDLWSLQAQAKRIERSIDINRVRLTAMTTGKIQPLSVQLAERQNYTWHILRKIEILRAEQADMRLLVSAAKVALRRANFSESQVDLIEL